MAIKSVYQSEVVTVMKNATLKEASRLMQKHHVGSLVVIEDFQGKKIPAGILTDRDLALTLGSSQKPQELRVVQIMQSQPITAKAIDGIFETVLKMREYGIKRLPVIDEMGSLCGIVCADDFLKLMGEEINSLSQITETQVKIEQGLRLPTEKVVQI